MIEKIIADNYPLSNIFYSHTPKDFIYNDHDWRYDLNKVQKLKHYDLVIADFSKENYGPEGLNSVYDLLDEYNINFLLLTHHPADHLTKSRLLFWPHWYYNTGDQSQGYVPTYSVENYYLENTANLEKKYKLSCLNGNARSHKIYNFLKLRKKSYYQTTLFEMYNSDAYLHSDFVHLDPTSLVEWEYLKEQLPHINIFTGSESNNKKSAYTDSYLQLVVEGHMWPFVHITEKIWKVISAGQLFLILGGENEIAHLRNMGVDVFDDFINHNYYDSESDWQKRIIKIHELIDNLMTQDLLKINVETRLRREENARKFFSKEFGQQYPTALKNKIEEFLNK